MKCSNHEAVIDAIMEQYNQGRMEMSVVHGPYSVGKRISLESYRLD